MAKNRRWRGVAEKLAVLLASLAVGCWPLAVAQLTVQFCRPRAMHSGCGTWNVTANGPTPTASGQRTVCCLRGRRHHASLSFPRFAARAAAADAVGDSG